MTEFVEYSVEQFKIINELIEIYNRDVPFFYDEGVCKVSYIPIADGELRVFHHKPKNPISKRPVLFIPGFGTSPWAWRHFGVPFHEKCEYYFLETREKTSSQIIKRRKTKMSINQTAKDLGQVIKYLKLDQTDFVLYGASYCGGVVLWGLAKKYFTAPTVILFDPLESFKNHRKYVYVIAPLPIFILNILKFVIMKLFLLGMKNKVQKERVKDYVKNAEMWKWKKAGLQNFRFDVRDILQNISEEVYIFHSAYDIFHPASVFIEIAKKIPAGRYVYMLAEEKYRELITGIIGMEYSKITKETKLPNKFKHFLVDVDTFDLKKKK